MVDLSSDLAVGVVIHERAAGPITCTTVQVTD
jgi:hypothetical protein